MSRDHIAIATCYKQGNGWQQILWKCYLYYIGIDLNDIELISCQCSNLIYRSVYAQNDIQDYSTSSHNWGGEDVAQRVDDLESHSKNEFEDSLDECISTSSALPDSFNNKVIFFPNVLVWY